jgi:hypothetical protein
MAKSFKRGKVSRKSLRKGRKSLRRGRKSLRRGKGFRKNVKKMHGGTTLTDLLHKMYDKNVDKYEIANLEANIIMNNETINEPDNSEDKLTPLHIACFFKPLNSNLLQMLINYRADVNAKTAHGYTPLDILMITNKNDHTNDTRNKVKDCLKILLKKGGKFEKVKLEESPFIKYIKTEIEEEKKMQDDEFHSYPMNPILETSLREELLNKSFNSEFNPEISYRNFI